MAGRLQDKVAVITGGASGMGRAAALRFLEEGARVIIADMNDASGEETLELAAQGGHGQRARFIHTDVAEESDVEAMIGLAQEEFSRVDCIFNNAGVGGAFGPLTEIQVEDWDYTFAVLTRGVFLGMKHGARVLKAQGQGGSILNTASVAGLSGGAGPLAYSAAKAAVVNLTLAGAVELARHRIRVNALCPGVILTPLVHRGRPAKAEENLKKLQPWPEAGRAEHVAAAALFLASDEGEFLTGEALVIDGGLTAAGPDLLSRARDWGGTGPFEGRSGVNRGSTGLKPIVRS